MLPNTLNLKDFNYEDFFHAKGLKELDHRFLESLKSYHTPLYQSLLDYRKNPAFSAEDTSLLLLEVAPLLENFMAELFQIEKEVTTARLLAKKEDPIFVFKAWYVLREAKRKLNEANYYPNFHLLNQSLHQEIEKEGFCKEDKELAVALLGVKYLEDPAFYEKEIRMLIQWCVKSLTDEEGKQAVAGWVSFHLPKRTEDQKLVFIEKVDEIGRSRSKPPFRQREGFNLTDHRMQPRQVLSEANYCIYCHTHQGDFCSTGFPVKKTQPALGLKTHSLGEVMTGCPLDEKISEMNFLKKEGYSIASLAVIMVDNPMCPVTGHRICNDCMKACIYQKQTPVDIPQVETAVLTDVLKLPWGVEIYDLLTRWNPLRRDQPIMKPFNGHKVLIAGMGPAGFSMAHYLTMEGCAVVGVDGLKIEPLEAQWIEKPIYDWENLKESLDDRLVSGFGGVAEYGITVRWDKNFLKLIYISLMRRHPYFKLYGNVRLGGTLTVENAFEMGFDHLCIAVGAGLPQAISIPNSLAPGMRQANDFLMMLQLMGAAKRDHLASLQIRLPALIIGGGLTAIDTATEAQAYYIRQVEKILFHEEVLTSKLGKKEVEALFNPSEKEILREFLSHAMQIREERKQAQRENRKPNFLRLIEQWGGVTIVYRRSIQESPAYRFNHEELKKALEEGIYYLEGLKPIQVLLDAEGQTEALVCRKSTSVGNVEEKILPARSIFVATGSKPNIAYEFEHRGTFRRSGHFYDMFKQEEGILKEVPKGAHVKSPELGIFTSYLSDGRYVSFLGDTHPLFQGSVVKAIASSKRSYPEVMKVLSNRFQKIEEYGAFLEKIEHLFSAHVVSIQSYLPDVYEIRIHAPMACQNFRPGEFYRIQTYETFSKKTTQTRFQTEPLAVLGVNVDSSQGELSFFVWKKGVSSRWIGLLKAGDPLSIMGPTGVRVKIPKDQETVLILGETLSIPSVLALGKVMRAAGNRVLYMGCFKTARESCFLEQITAATDQIIWTIQQTDTLQMKRIQDTCISLNGHKNYMKALVQYEQNRTDFQISLKTIDRILVTGDPAFLKQFKEASHTFLKEIWAIQKPKIILSVYSTMQCMLKGICAQCLQWQIDPETGERTKAVFACSWQDQPMELIDIDHLAQRLSQNSVQEKLYSLWATEASQGNS